MWRKEILIFKLRKNVLNVFGNKNNRGLKHLQCLLIRISGPYIVTRNGRVFLHQIVFCLECDSLMSDWACNSLTLLRRKEICIHIYIMSQVVFPRLRKIITLVNKVLVFPHLKVRTTQLL